VSEYNKTYERVYDPETAILEVCTKCGAKPMESCVTDTGGKTSAHTTRLEAREERKAFIYEKENWKTIQRTRHHNKIRREKREANPSGNPTKRVRINPNKKIRTHA
jgi:hypothetical protein